jgi:regulatory protein
LRPEPRQQSEQFQRGLKKALDLLRMRDRFTSEVRQVLKGSGCPPEDVEHVLSWLQEKNILDDRRTINNTIERRTGKRSIGRDKLRAELLSKGAPEELVEEALVRMSDDGEADAAYEALQARPGSGLSRPKAARFLYSRGFSEDTVEQTLDRFFGSVE